jgi:hypothetical protein
MNQGSPFQISLKFRTGLDSDICASGLIATALRVDRRPEMSWPVATIQRKDRQAGTAGAVAPAGIINRAAKLMESAEMNWGFVIVIVAYVAYCAWGSLFMKK